MSNAERNWLADEDDWDDDEPDDCGMTFNGFCMFAGSDYCDWECPFAQDDYDEDEDIEW